MLLTNGRVFTDAHDDRPVSAMQVSGTQICWTGKTADAPVDAGPVFDLGGRTVLPGLTDPHLHLLMLALTRLQLCFANRAVANFEELFLALGELDPGKEPGGWLQGCVLIEDTLAERRLPTRNDLDPVFPDTPVLLRRYCGHVAVMNTAALNALGLNEDTPDPPGGTFFRDAEGRLTGLADETAADLVFARAPAPSVEALSDAILDAIHECLGYGLTSLIEAAVGFSLGFDREMAVWEHLRAHRELPARLGFMHRLHPQDAAARGMVPERDERWSSETLKFFADGIIGGRSGAISFPYADTGGMGALLHGSDDLHTAFAQAHEAGWRIAVHATGDRGIAQTAAAMAEAQGADTTRRHRIEHVFVPPASGPGSLQHLAASGILTVTQPGFLERMGLSIRRGLGARADADCYPAASVLGAGGALAFSSDAPTGPLSPWTGIACAMSRAAPDGNPIAKSEALDLRTALAAYIHGGAYAMNHEGFRGRLEAGQAADFVVLERDPFEADAQIATMKAVLVVSDGRVVLDRLQD